jgi:hypothetical protein
MIRPILFAALFGSLATFAHAQGPLPFKVNSLEVIGSGCADETDSRVVLGDDIVLRFADFTASPDRVDPPRPGASCTLTAKIDVRPGYTLTLGPAELRGYASSRGEAMLLLFSRLFPAGDPGETQTYELPENGAWVRWDPGTLTLENCDGRADDAIVGATYSILAPRPGSFVRLSSVRMEIAAARCK